MKFTRDPVPFSPKATLAVIDSWPSVIAAKRSTLVSDDRLTIFTQSALEIMERAHETREHFLNMEVEYRRVVIGYIFFFAAALSGTVLTTLLFIMNVFSAYAWVIFATTALLGLIGIMIPVIKFASSLLSTNSLAEAYYKSELSSQVALTYLKASLVSDLTILPDDGSYTGTSKAIH